VIDIASVKFDTNGLVPAIVQDSQTLKVLMLGYMSKDSLKLTIATGKVTFWSRSRNEIWVKGATSGNFLNLVSLALDCDSDAILVSATPVGPTCHTGSDSCFDNGDN
jgi:phosphoribosyl-ATP pyrophosphohydrolase/phosphoribosyl-AMP cyclohydrolase